MRNVPRHLEQPASTTGCTNGSRWVQWWQTAYDWTYVAAAPSSTVALHPNTAPARRRPLPPDTPPAIQVAMYHGTPSNRLRLLGVPTVRDGCNGGTRRTTGPTTLRLRPHRWAARRSSTGRGGR